MSSARSAADPDGAYQLLNYLAAKVSGTENLNVSPNHQPTDMSLRPYSPDGPFPDLPAYFRSSRGQGSTRSRQSRAFFYSF